MMKFMKNRWFWLIIILSSVALGTLKFPQRIEFSDAQNRAEKRFLKLAAYDNLRPGDFSSVSIEERQESWLFKWSFQNGIGAYIIIVERDGEMTGGPDQELYDLVAKNKQKK